MSHGSKGPSRAPDFHAALVSGGFDFFCGVPCSLLKGLVSLLEKDHDARYVSATREDSALEVDDGDRERRQRQAPREHDEGRTRLAGREKSDAYAERDGQGSKRRREKARTGRVRARRRRRTCPRRPAPTPTELRRSPRRGCTGWSP